MPSRTLPVRRPDASTASLTLTTAADPAAPVLVVVPAMGMRAAWYPPLAAALLAAGVSTAVTELRGHEATVGAVPGRDHDFGYADLAADLGAALAVVRRELPAAPIVLLGHSMGGHVACALLADHPDAAAGLVLVTSGTTYWRHWSPWHLLRTQAAVGLSRVVGHFPGARVGFAGREARGVMRDWGRLARRGVLATGVPPRDHGPALTRLALPVLAVSVARDALSPRRAVVGMTGLLPAADVEFVHLAPAPGEPALDHFRWAREPDAVVRPLRVWLRGQVGSRMAQTPRGEGFPVVRSSVHERGGGPRNACSTDS